ncbi:hypothetical protein J2T58_000218 [Methanocalculus alkaliphilus]|uniref:hypothetical protein n=1 Tax=Methanocalculus alkaliphilus TaxID=768730 RepID=UPI00209E8D9F|nr:hypothetical protein [Methanocalculus alkaliphilus]MCP1714391.1 hypothetical protein [Methanocalculus alkaliphilus]
MENSCQTDDPRRALLKVSGTTIQEKCAELGIIPGGRHPLGMLNEIALKYGIDIYLFLDERIARHSTMKDDLEDFRVVPPQARPYLEVRDFFRMVRDQQLPVSDPENLSAEIIAIGETECVSCGGASYKPYIRSYLPPP